MVEFFSGTFSEVFSKVYFTNLVEYFIISGFFFVIFYIIFRRKFLALKIQQKFPKGSDIRREVGYSIVTVLFFGLVGALLLATPLKEYTLQYDDFSEHGWGYFFLSLGIMILFHDTYFYWTHRLLHQKFLLKHVHKIHHMSHSPTPWAAFSFHPVEGLISVAHVMIIVFLIPLHIATVVTFLVWMFVYNAYGHSGFELFGKKTSTHWFGKWWQKAMYHDMHHSKSEGNYGLYFTFWDRTMGTFISEDSIEN